MTDREPGFTRLLEAGYTPRQAWQKIRNDLTGNPLARAIFTALEATPEGRAVLGCVRDDWTRRGLPAPFDDLPHDRTR